MPLALLMLCLAFAGGAAHPASGRSSRAAYGVYAVAVYVLIVACAAAGLRLFELAGRVALPEIVWSGAQASGAMVAVILAWRLRKSQQRLRYGFEQLVLWVLAAAATLAIFVTAGIVASVLFEAVRFFNWVSVGDFLLGLHWSPQIAIREDQVGGSGAFGFVPLLVGTLLISGIAMAVATPMGLFIAAYLSEFAKNRVRNRVKPVLEVLAGIPTIVYGFFALTVLSPFIVDLGESLGAGVAGENALAVGIVMGFLLVPFIASLSEDAFHAVPDSLRQGALGLGATKYEMTVGVVFPAALPGVVAGILLAFSRAVGETMIVVMAAGISANLSVNPLQAVTTVTVQIVTLLTGDQEFDDPKTLAAFALGLVLFVVTLSFNFVALRVVQRYRQRYE